MAVDRETLVSELLQLGVRPGGLLMVHASLRAVGPVDGGAVGLLHALRAAQGEAGTLVMVLGADADEPFDAAETEVDVQDMGWLAEVFRTQAEVLVSDHAAARWGAWGPLAPELVAEPPLHDYHGPEGTLQRLVDHDGQVLRLGADPDTLTLTHLAEYLADLPNKRRVRRRYVRADIGEQWIESLDDDDGIVAEPDYFAAVLASFLAAGRARVGTVGASRAELLDARGFIAFAVPWLERHLPGAK